MSYKGLLQSTVSILTIREMKREENHTVSCAVFKYAMALLMHMVFFKISFLVEHDSKRQKTRFRKGK